MLRKIIAAVAATGMLAGCAGGVTPVVTTPPVVTVPGITAAQLQAIILAVQTYTVAACQYEPTAKTIAQIAATFYAPSALPISIASTVADSICQSVTAKSLKRGHLPSVNGVPIHGRFVS